MADFDDSADPELGAACNRLAAWVERLPVAAVIDRDTGLTERDLALILRHLHATRHQRPAAGGAVEAAVDRPQRASVPITAKH